jgi:hypothetical protein
MFMQVATTSHRPLSMPAALSMVAQHSTGPFHASAMPPGRGAAANANDPRDAVHVDTNVGDDDDARDVHDSADAIVGGDSDDEDDDATPRVRISESQLAWAKQCKKLVGPGKPWKFDPEMTGLTADSKVEDYWRRPVWFWCAAHLVTILSTCVVSTNSCECIATFILVFACTHLRAY